MTPSVYPEDTLVQQTTAEHLEQELDWQPVYACNNEKQELIKDGVQVAFRNTRGERVHQRLRVCDFDIPGKVLTTLHPFFLRYSFSGNQQYSQLVGGERVTGSSQV